MSQRQLQCQNNCKLPPYENQSTRIIKPYVSGNKKESYSGYQLHIIKAYILILIIKQELSPTGTDMHMHK